MPRRFKVMAERQSKPVVFKIRNFGKTRQFCVKGLNYTITHDQEMETTDFDFAKYMNEQYMVQVKKKATGLPI
jgi:hypothetical protein